MILRFPVESILRSIRSLVSLNSNTSNIDFRSYTELGTPVKMREGPTQSNPNVKLVPQKDHGRLSARATAHWQDTEQFSQDTEWGHWTGTRVHETIDVIESRTSPGLQVKLLTYRKRHFFNASPIISLFT